MVLLSFNPAQASLLDLHEHDDALGLSEPSPSDMRLRSRWIFWEQLASNSGKSLPYSESTKQIASCETVDEFWRTWDRLPQPSELIANRMVHHEGDNSHVVDALMVFCDGIAPQWEDKANINGGHFQFQFKATSGGIQIDEYWNNLALAVLGATLEPSDMITGIRLVDKLSGPRGAGHVRIEVWFSDLSDTQAVQQLQHSVERCIATKTLGGRIGAVPAVELKHHRMTRH
uniref:Eukaryotic initiation factor 4E n=1 Tax=Pfiesteria piscicida TaxID=71001 RepID=A3E3L3_PFIPI|nr:eukaryotic initiation factor 4E [Pfiesteria piscicida]